MVILWDGYEPVRVRDATLEEFSTQARADAAEETREEAADEKCADAAAAERGEGGDGKRSTECLDERGVRVDTSHVDPTFVIGDERPCAHCETPARRRWGMDGKLVCEDCKRW